MKSKFIKSTLPFLLLTTFVITPINDTKAISPSGRSQYGEFKIPNKSKKTDSKKEEIKETTMEDTEDKKDTKGQDTKDKKSSNSSNTSNTSNTLKDEKKTDNHDKKEDNKGEKKNNLLDLFKNDTTNTKTEDKSKAEPKETTNEDTGTSKEENKDSGYDPVEYYSKDNPKKFSPYPIVPDLSNIKDESDSGLEKERLEIQKYLKEKYSNHDWHVINVIKLKNNGKDYIRAEAFSKDSMDVIIWVYIDGDKITDTFKEDVIERANTLLRLSDETIPILDELTSVYYPTSEAYCDIRYDLFRENISKVKLDEEIDHKDNNLKRLMSVSIKKGETDKEIVSEKADKLFTVLKSEGYTADEYYVLMYKGTENNYRKFFFKVPKDLIGSDDFKEELQKAIENPDDSSNKITPHKNNGELHKN